jgi:hypothetical protein
VESGVLLVVLVGGGGGRGSRAQSQAEKVKVGQSRVLGKGSKSDIIGRRLFPLHVNLHLGNTAILDVSAYNVLIILSVTAANSRIFE